MKRDKREHHLLIEVRYDKRGGFSPFINSMYTCFEIQNMKGVILMGIEREKNTDNFVMRTYSSLPHQEDQIDDLWHLLNNEENPLKHKVGGKGI